MRPSIPPRLPSRLLARAVGRGPVGQSILGDLHEEFVSRSKRSRRRADLWYWRVALPLALSTMVWRAAGGEPRRRRDAGSKTKTPSVSLSSGGILGDLRYACRLAFRRPLLSLIAIVTIGIGIGANTAVSSVAWAFLGRSLPGIQEPERVVELGRMDDGQGFDTFAYPDIVDLRQAASGVLDEIAVFKLDLVSSMLEEVGVRGGVRWTAMYTSANYFDVLGAEPVLGRRFEPAYDEMPSGEPTVVLSHRVWRDRFGSDPGVIGRTIDISRQAVTVIGVLPADFKSHIIGLDPDVWLPLGQYPRLLTSRSEGLSPLKENRNASWLMSIARLAEGATQSQADAAVRATFELLAQEHPDSNTGRGARAVGLGPIPGGGRSAMTAFLAVLMALVALVLVLTCSNVTGLLLANAVVREKEVAVRLALGSSRWQLVRQLLAESMVLFVLGGALGVTVAFVGVSSISLTGLPVEIPISLDLSPDGRVLGYALLLTLVAGLVFGVAPALQASRPDLIASLKGLGDDMRSRWLRRLLVTAQIAASVVLLAAAGLFLRSIQKVGEIETGFDGASVLTTTIDLSLEGYDDEERGQAYFDQVVERLRAQPHIEEAAFSIDLPLDLAVHGSAVEPQGITGGASAFLDERGRLRVSLNRVTAGYLDVLGIRLLEGRGIEERDRGGAQKVALVSRELAGRVWPSGGALGKTFRFLGIDGEPEFLVVGVVDDVKNSSLTEEPRSFVYLPLKQAYTPSVILSVRTSGDPEASQLALRETILSVDPSVSLTPLISLERVTGVTSLPQRAAASVTSVLGLVALLLSGLGIYGVVAVSVARRSREIGIRMALGARRQGVLMEVMKQAVRLAAPGVLIGLVLALLGSRLALAFLVDVEPTDPLTMISVAVLIGGVVILASLVPARRASAVDPVEVLRSE